MLLSTLMSAASGPLKTSMSRYTPPRERAPHRDGDNRTTVVLFIHLRKCAGTSVRELFGRRGLWGLLPYCASEDRVIRGMARMQPPDPYLFWEDHCNFFGSNLPHTINATRHLPWRPRVWSFILLRHPVNLTLSYHNYFNPNSSLEAWTRNHSELLLQYY